MKKCFNVLISFILFFSISIPAFANSGIGYVEGVNNIGVVTEFEKCPVTVEKEILTFEINTFPVLDDINFRSDEWLAEYSDRVTAEYTFHNPTEYDIKTKLYFPFNYLNEYISHDSNGHFRLNRGTDKYNITVNGQTVEKKTRFTYSPGKFDADNEINELKDGYINHNFFKSDLPVTKYIYRDSAYGTDENSDRDFQLDWENIDDKSAILVPNASSWQSTGDRKGEFGIHIYSDKDIVVYIFGQQPENPPQVNGYIANGLTASLQRTEEMTFEQFVLEEFAVWDETTGISQQDWYNICTDYLINGTDMNKMVTDINMIHFYPYSNILCWYEYEVEIPAGESVTNTVTAPLFPLMNYEYEPYVYEYTYLLSPAKGWAEFDNIEININTPYHILEINQEGFMKSESGYSYKYNGLPEGELVFSLSESDSPKVQVNKGYLWFIAIPVLFIIGLIVFFLVLIRNVDRKNEEKEREERNRK